MILVFAGAGASKAVNPSQYPTTVEFFQRLPAEVTDAPLFKQLLEYLESHGGKAPPDVEQVLWALGEWDEFVAAAKNRSAFPGYLFNKQKLNELGAGVVDQRPVLKALDHVRTLSQQLASAINERVYAFYRRPPEAPELDSTWLPLLNLAGSLEPRIDVFTTNYDLVLESAIELGGIPIETGRTQGITPHLEVDLWNAAPGTRKTGLLTKLHGSIDWIRGDGNEIYVGTPQFTGRHQQHAIIYPGFKGAPQEPPFTLFHDYFRTAADQASAALFVGFAFRDEYISAIARERLKPGIPIVLIGLGPQPDQVPFRKGQYRYIDKGFTHDAVDEALGWIGKTL